MFPPRDASSREPTESIALDRESTVQRPSADAGGRNRGRRIDLVICLKFLFFVVLGVQAVHLLMVVVFDVMLHGDGSFFVFAISAGSPWTIKWAAIAARSTVYVTTVVPTFLLAKYLALSPLSIARLNGAVFYLVPLIQTAYAGSLVWRRDPKLLLFLILQFVFGTTLGFGFPSEILIAPGFLWICLFLIHNNRIASPLFFASFVALVFTHELAVPSALVVGWIAIRNSQDRPRDTARFDWMPILVGLGIAATLLALIIVLKNGGGRGSSGNVLYVVDPRRIVNNPNAWLEFGFVALVWMLARKANRRGQRTLIVGLVGLAAFASPIVLQALLPDINFSQGRYDSARSLIGGLMLVLSLLYLRYSQGEEVVTRWIAGDTRRFGMLAMIVVAIASAEGSSLAFLQEWNVGLRGMRKVVSAPPADHPAFVKIEDVIETMSPDERRTNEALGFYWVLPFKSFVLADGAAPRMIITAPVDYSEYCEPLFASRRNLISLPAPAYDDLARYVCDADRPPPLNTLTRRLKRWFGERFKSTRE